MKKFIGFVIKEFYHILRDKRTLFIIFGMPVAQILLFGFAISNEIKNVDISIYDKAKDENSKKLIAKIDASSYFNVLSYVTNEKEMRSAFQKGDVQAILSFQETFSKNLTTSDQARLQIITDASNPNIANSIHQYLTSITKDLGRSLDLSSKAAPMIITEPRMMFNPELKSVYMFVPGVMTVILMLVSAMMTSISITREKEVGTMEVLLVSPLKPTTVILGKVTPYILLSMVNALIIILMSLFIFDMPVNGSYLWLSAQSLLFIITSLSLGIMISTMSNTQQTAMMISLMGLMLPTILLSGFIFPISSMPLPLQVISNIIPAKWFILILKDIMLKGVDLSYFWKESLVLVALASLFLLVSIKKYKTRLE